MTLQRDLRQDREQGRVREVFEAQVGIEGVGVSDPTAAIGLAAIGLGAIGLGAAVSAAIEATGD